MELTKEQIKNFKSKELKSKDFNSLINLGNKIVRGGDTEWASTIFKKAEGFAEDCEEYSKLALTLKYSTIENVKIWINELCKIASEKASNYDEHFDLAGFFASFIKNNELAELHYKKAKELLPDGDDFAKEMFDDAINFFVNKLGGNFEIEDSNDIYKIEDVLNFVIIGEYFLDKEGEVNRTIEVKKLSERNRLVYLFVSNGKVEYVGATKVGYKRPLKYHRNINADNNLRNVHSCLKEVLDSGGKVQVYARIFENIKIPFEGLSLNPFLAYEEALIYEFKPEWNEEK